MHASANYSGQTQTKVFLFYRIIKSLWFNIKIRVWQTTTLVSCLTVIWTEPCHISYIICQDVMKMHNYITTRMRQTDNLFSKSRTRRTMRICRYIFMYVCIYTQHSSLKLFIAINSYAFLSRPFSCPHEYTNNTQCLHNHNLVLHKISITDHILGCQLNQANWPLFRSAFLMLPFLIEVLMQVKISKIFRTAIFIQGHVD